jgi:hypothetical protein
VKRGTVALSLLVACGGSPEADSPTDVTAAEPVTIEVLPTEDGDVAETEAFEPTSEEAEVAPEPLDTDALPLVCEEYLAEMERCFATVAETSPQVATSMQQAMLAQRDAFAAANTPEAREALALGCEMGLKAVRDNPACNEPAP